MRTLRGNFRRLGGGRSKGFTLVLLLIFIFVSGIALSAVVTVWTTAARRDREVELLFVGAQYRQAIESYYKSTPGAGQLPQKLGDLLEDTRTGVLKRHLRRLYRDPMTGEPNWGLVKVGDRIAGVYSVSMTAPIKVSGLDLPGAESAEAYQDWKFVFADAVSAAQRTGAPGAAGAAGSTTGGSTGGPVATLEPQEPSALTKEACDRQRQLDLHECDAVRGYIGVTKDDVELCLGSARQRVGLCLQGKGAQAPPLAIPALDRAQ